MSPPKPFAKLFAHPTLGQMLVQRETNDDDQPGVSIKFDPGIEDLAPCHIFLAVGGVDDETANQAADQLFENTSEETAAKIVEKQVDLIRGSFGVRH